MIKELIKTINYCEECPYYQHEPNSSLDGYYCKLCNQKTFIDCSLNILIPEWCELPTKKCESFTAETIQELRRRSGCGLVHCRKVLEECGGSVDKSLKYMKNRPYGKI